MSSKETDIHSFGRTYYQVPYPHDLTGLDITDGIMILIYLVVLCFTVFNTYRYLYQQRRYKNWLVTVFYVFSFIVLLSRLMYYIMLIVFNEHLRPIVKTDSLSELDSLDLVSTIDALILQSRLVGVFFLIADYAKYALGFF